MLGRGGGALFIAFQGTKELRDLAADAAMAQRALWEQQQQHGGRGTAPAAHGGFLLRADAVPVEGLYLHAMRQGLRLVLCGSVTREAHHACRALRCHASRAGDFRVHMPARSGVCVGEAQIC